MIVDCNGNGDYLTIQAAVNDIDRLGQTDRTIRIRPGIYHERVVVFPNDLKLVGEGADQTIITFSGCAKDLDENGQEKGTFLSYTFLITGENVTLENLTIRNDAGEGSAVGQAVALYAAGDRGSFRNCRFIAHQDTLFCGPLMPKVANRIRGLEGTAECVPSVGDSPVTTSREYFDQCFIQGDIDFIFGPYRCWFERCTLFMNSAGGWYTAANTPREQEFGFVFHECDLTGACEEGAAYLGRPWRPYARTVFLECSMDEHVSPQGFADWDAGKPITDRCGEWGTKGVRKDQGTRHPAQKRLTDQEAENITLRAVIGGSDGWQPDMN